MGSRLHLKRKRWHSNRHSDQQDRIENPEMDPQTYGPLIFDKARKNMQRNTDSLFSKWCWENCTATGGRINLDHFLTPWTKINSKWMKDLNVRQETIKILEENTGSNLGQSNFLLDALLKARGTKTNLNYWDLIKIKSFCTVKEIINKTKSQPMEWELVSANYISDNGFSIQNLSRTYQTQYPKTKQPS